MADIVVIAKLENNKVEGVNLGSKSLKPRKLWKHGKP